MELPFQFLYAFDPFEPSASLCQRQSVEAPDGSTNLASISVNNESEQQLKADDTSIHPDDILTRRS